MENKEIYIDGVDVSRCTRYCADNGKCTAFKSQYLCSERNNCYTKRILKKNKTINILKEKLLRKEQECEGLKKKIKYMEEHIKIVENARNEFERKSKFLKEENTEIRKYQYEQDFLQQQLDQLKKTLDTIKEICNNNDELQGNFNLVDCDKYKLGKHNLANKIIQKISECEEINANI